MHVKQAHQTELYARVLKKESGVGQVVSCPPWGRRGSAMTEGKINLNASPRGHNSD